MNIQLATIHDIPNWELRAATHLCGISFHTIYKILGPIQNTWTVVWGEVDYGKYGWYFKVDDLVYEIEADDRIPVFLNKTWKVFIYYDGSIGETMFGEILEYFIDVEEGKIEPEID